MKIVVFGPDRRVGALHGDDVIDLNGAYAKLALEVQDEPVAYAAADANAPADLEQFITLGERALEAATRAVEYVTTRAGDHLGPRGESVIVAVTETKIHAPLAHRGVKICMAGANYWDHLFDMMRAQDPSVTPEDVRTQSRKRG